MSHWGFTLILSEEPNIVAQILPMFVLILSQQVGPSGSHKDPELVPFLERVVFLERLLLMDAFEKLTLLSFLAGSSVSSTS
mmetsp:Transcript_24915/g.47750  ORF Transcript_24915/g.47750 Transcript_24915/m.47750 type:complete len:81 (+) Transcript_24915:1287-1529(+)